MARRDYGSGGIYYDAKRDRGVGSVEAGWSARGTRRRKIITGKSKRAVQIKLREARAAADPSPTEGGRPTVKTWADRWLEVTAERLRPTAWQADRSQVVRWIVPTIGHRRLDQLTPSDRRALTRAMDHAGLAPSTITRAQAVLGKMLRDAIVEGHQVAQAAMMVKAAPVATESDRDAILLPDALAILAAAAERPDGSRWVAALLQGMRPAECLGLTWERVDLEAGWTSRGSSSRCPTGWRGTGRVVSGCRRGMPCASWTARCIWCRRRRRVAGG